MKVLLVLMLCGAWLQMVHTLKEGPFYTTRSCLLIDAAGAGFPGILTVSFLCLRPRRDGVPRTWRRRLIISTLTILVGAALSVAGGWIVYFPQWNGFPPDLPAYTQYCFLRGLFVSGAMVAVLLVSHWLLGLAPKPLRWVATALLIGGTLVAVDQAVNEDLVYGRQRDFCLSCSASWGSEQGEFHGWFEYHEGERVWLNEPDRKAEGCNHTWVEVHSYSY